MLDDLLERSTTDDAPLSTMGAARTHTNVDGKTAN
jgi:hypothetical protein